MGRKFIVEEIIEDDKKKPGGCVTFLGVVVMGLLVWINGCNDEKPVEDAEQTQQEVVVDVTESASASQTEGVPLSDLLYVYSQKEEAEKPVVEPAEAEQIQLEKEQPAEVAQEQVEESQLEEKSDVVIVDDIEPEVVPEADVHTKKTARKLKKAIRKAKRGAK